MRKEVPVSESTSFVGVDLGRQNVIYSSKYNVNDSREKVNVATLSFAQLKSETKATRYDYVGHALRRVSIDGDSIDTLLAKLHDVWSLTRISSATCCLSNFERYLCDTRELRSKLANRYSDRWHRQLKANTDLNKGKAYHAFFNRFVGTFGYDIIVCIGVSIDGPTPNTQRKTSDWTEVCGSRKLMQMFACMGRTKIPVFLVDDFRTTLACFRCQEGMNEVFLKGPNPYQDDKDALIHRIKQCQVCGHTMNRDKTGLLNQARLGHVLFTCELDLALSAEQLHHVAQHPCKKLKRSSSDSDLTMSSLWPKPWNRVFQSSKSQNKPVPT
jgi:transposase